MTAPAEDYLRPFIKWQRRFLGFDILIHGLWLILALTNLVSCLALIIKADFSADRFLFMAIGLAHSFLFFSAFYSGYWVNRKLLRQPQTPVFFAYLSTVYFFSIPLIVLLFMIVTVGGRLGFTWGGLQSFFVWDSPFLVMATPFVLYKFLYLFVVHQYSHWNKELKKISNHHIQSTAFRSASGQ